MHVNTVHDKKMRTPKLLSWIGTSYIAVTGHVSRSVDHQDRTAYNTKST